MADTLEEIYELAQHAGDHMQEIQTSLGDRTYVQEARVRFPRGYVRTAGGIYNSLPDIGDNTKRRNFAYQLMRADVVRWLLTRTDVFGQVQSVLVAEYICILAYGVEFFAKTLNYRKVAKDRPMKRHTQNLVDDRTIGPELKVELDWMWDVRTREHLDATTDLRHCTHDHVDFNRATGAWTAFMERMQAAQFSFRDED